MQSFAHSETANGEAEVALKAIAQSACGALVATTEGEIVYANPRFCEISGYTLDELRGQNPRMLQSGNTPRETYLLLWNTITSGRPWHGVLQNRKKCGELYWESITITPLKNTQGEITHFSAILEDITSEKTIEREQAELAEEIFQEEKRESLTAMAIGMAHVLNNSLACITGACDLVKKNVNNPAEQLQLIELIESTAHQSAQFLHQAGALWKPSAQQTLTVDLEKVLERHLSHYRSAVSPHLLHFESSATATPTVADPALIHQAILALLANAKQSNERAPVTLRCGESARLAPGADEYFISCGLNGLSVVYCEVLDSGSGMDAYTLRRAFNPFYSTKSGHRGLGLAVVYGVMSAHKGAIGVASTPGEGTRIRLYFKKR